MPQAWAHHMWARLPVSGSSGRSSYGMGETSKSKLSSKFTFSLAVGPLTVPEVLPVYVVGDSIVL
jgi:hypothetical protein